MTCIGIIRGGSRIPCRRGRRPSGGCQHMILSAWNRENFWPYGGARVARPQIRHWLWYCTLFWSLGKLCTFLSLNTSKTYQAAKKFPPTFCSCGLDGETFCHCYFSKQPMRNSHKGFYPHLHWVYCPKVLDMLFDNYGTVVIYNCIII